MVVSEREIPSILLILGTALAGVFFLISRPSIALWALLGGVLLTAVYVLWQSARLLAGEEDVAGDLEDARFDPRGLDTELDEEKRSILTQLKDIERERRIGKLSEEDYASLAAVYRARAKQILAAIDEQLSAHRAEAQQLLSAEKETR